MLPNDAYIDAYSRSICPVRRSTCFRRTRSLEARVPFVARQLVPTSRPRGIVEKEARKETRRIAARSTRPMLSPLFSKIRVAVQEHWPRDFAFYELFRCLHRCSRNVDHSLFTERNIDAVGAAQHFHAFGVIGKSRANEV